MFSKKSSAAALPSADKSTRDTVIGAGARAEGVLETAHDVFIAGAFNGTIRCDGTVVLNTSARLEADVTAACVVVHGEVTGNVTAHDKLEVGTTGRIRGDVRAGSARVSEGGQLEGRCTIVSGEEATPCAVDAPAEDTQVA